MAPRLTGLLVAIVLVLARGGGAVCAADDQSLELAKQHFDEGQVLFVAGQYAEAAREFEKAYEAKPFPAFLYNIALCHEKNQDFNEALETYRKYLEKDPHTPDRPAVEQRIAAIRQHLEPTASRPTSQPTGAPPAAAPPARVKGMVVIESKPPGAAIYIDSKRNGVFARTPFHGSLSPGDHTILIEKRKYKPARSKPFYFRPDVFSYFSFDLSAEHYLGWIDVRANVSGADVFFDSQAAGAVGRTRYTGFLKPGRHTVYVARAGYQTVSRVVEIGAGKDHELDLNLQKVPYGWLRVTGQTTRGARVLVEGKPLSCLSTPCQTELAPGQYSVEVQRKGWKSYRQRVTVRQAARTQLAVRLMPKPPRTKAWVSFGVSAAFIAGGIACGVISTQTGNSVQLSLPGRPVDSSDSRFFTGSVLAITADVLFGLGAVTAGVGLYYLLRNEGPDSYGETRETQIALDGATDLPRRVARRPRPTISLWPSFGPGGLGLSGLVRF